MRAWHFSENAYPYLPPADEYESIRVNLPNRNYDPKVGASLYDRLPGDFLLAPAWAQATTMSRWASRKRSATRTRTSRS